MVEAPDAIGTPSIHCLGRLLAPPLGLEPAVADALVWHAADGWSPLDRVEIERWMVDAPAGSHWLLSERPMERAGRWPERSDVRLTIWDPDRLAVWIGEAVLAGDLTARPAGFVEPRPDIDTASGRLADQEDPSNGSSDAAVPRDTVRITNAVESLSGARQRAASSDGSMDSDRQSLEAYRPVIELQRWLEQNGFGMLQSTPVLLPARIWEVSGILRGPEDSAERRWWRILEDPMAGQVSLFDQAERLPSVPRLNIIEEVRWLGRDAVRLRLPDLCEVRKHWPSDGSGGSRLLHWWRLDPSSCEMSPTRALLPGWLVHLPFDGRHLLHGLSGSLTPMPV